MATIGDSSPEADLVLEGGGVKGMALVGAVMALSDAFPRIAGTSAGAIVGVVLAAWALWRTASRSSCTTASTAVVSSRTGSRECSVTSASARSATCTTTIAVPA